MGANEPCQEVQESREVLWWRCFLGGGEDLWVNQIAALEGRALVGKFRGRRMVVGTLNSWIAANWVSLIGYAPIFHLLSRGWIMFIFRTKEDDGAIFVGRWYWNNHLLCAKP
jgi:hypothetical protein